MTSKVITVRPETLMMEARELMDKNRIRHLPVVGDNDKLLGIVTDRDIRSALPSRVLGYQCSLEEKERIEALTVKDIMTEKPHTVKVTYTLQDVLLLLQETRVGAFPVVDENGILRGIISVRDALRAFINVLGIKEPGTLLCIVAEDKVGQMKRIVDAITEENVSMGSILVARYGEEGKRTVYPYVLTNTVGRLKKKLEGLGYKLLDPMDWDIDNIT